jgi:protein-disulfide isomerase
MKKGDSLFRLFFHGAWGVAAIGWWLSPAIYAQSSSDPATASPPAAIVAGKPISEDELTARILPQLRQLRNQEYEVRSDALNSLIDQRLLDAEAARRGITVGELLRQEVDEKTPTPTDAEVQAFYQGQKDRINQPFEQVKDQLRQALLQNRAQQVRQGFLKTLRDQADVSIFLTPPRIEVDVNPDRIRGNAQAPVTIVEFSDFQCPYCQRAYPTVQSLLAKYPKQVKFSYRDFPLRGLHPQAQMAAQAGRCAGEQGKFWEFHDDLFTKPNLLSKEELAKHAVTVGLDGDKFASCLDSGRYDDAIEKDVQDGIQAGVTGTPAFFINGILLSGALPASEFERTIDSELAAHLKAEAPAP